MKRQPKILSLNGTFLIAPLLIWAGLIIFSQQSSLVVISNVKGAPSNMKIGELRSVMKGERQRWNDGTKVNIFLMKTTTDLGKVTCDKVYKMSGDKVKRFWLELTFGGRANAPTFCNSADELESLVAQNPGSIGILDKNNGKRDTKVVLIDGKESF